MKFEMFQQQPAVDYEPRLARIHRQLRDIASKMELIEVDVVTVAEIEGKVV